MEQDLCLLSCLSFGLGIDEWTLSIATDVLLNGFLLFIFKQLLLLLSSHISFALHSTVESGELPVVERGLVVASIAQTVESISLSVHGPSHVVVLEIVRSTKLIQIIAFSIAVLLLVNQLLDWVILRIQSVE